MTVHCLLGQNDALKALIDFTPPLLLQDNASSQEAAMFSRFFTFPLSLTQDKDCSLPSAEGCAGCCVVS